MQLKELLRKLRYEFHANESSVFKYKDQGDKLYFIIEGTVAVWVPRRTRDSILANKRMSFLKLEKID